jgi:thiol-disulfide isomerase/thioredoxin
MARKRLAVLICLGLAGALAVFAAGFYAGFRLYIPIMSRRWQRRHAARERALLGRPAGDVVTTTAAGEPWCLKDQRGKVVIIDFWSTTCGPCATLLPFLRNIHERFADDPDVVMVGVSLDEDPQTVLAYCKEREMRWLQLVEPGKRWENSFALAFQVRMIPEVCLVDRQGNISALHLRPGTWRSEEALVREVEALLGRSEQREKSGE